MTDARADLEALARRCESEGPSRLLDGEIAIATGREYSRHTRRSYEDPRTLREALDDARADGEEADFLPTIVDNHSIDHFTSSLDAAVSLVPSNYGWAVYAAGPTYPASAEIGPFRQGGGIDEHWGGDGATPALALCAAALRARAAMEAA